jgi:large subunit ribosomal protein L18
MNIKTKARLRRAKKSRVHMRTAGSVRLSVHRTPQHIYAQVISGDSKTILAQASTLDKDLRSSATGNVAAAAGGWQAGSRAGKGGWRDIGCV